MAARRPRNSALTIRAVLGAARKVFAEHGLSGTSLQMVEQESGVSKGLILHHFGSKEGLYDAVMKAASEDYTGWLKATVSFEQDFAGLMRDTIRASYRYFLKHEEIRRLRSWALLEQQAVSNDADERFTRVLIKAVADAQAAGVVRRDVPAVHVPFLIRAAIDYRLNNLAFVRRTERENGVAPKQGDELFLNSLQDLFLATPKETGNDREFRPA